MGFRSEVEIAINYNPGVCESIFIVSFPLLLMTLQVLVAFLHLLSTRLPGREPTGLSEEQAKDAHPFLFKEINYCSI